MRRIIGLSALLVVVISSGLAVIGPGSFGQGFLAALVVLTAAVAGLLVAWKWAGRSRSLAVQMGLAFGLRLGVGVLLLLLLPVIGFADSEVNQGGYSYLDAYNRDHQAWDLAVSDQSLSSAFSQEFSTDQYGGMLSLSAALYRGLSPDAHRPWLILIVTAFVSALGVPFLYKALCVHFEPAVVSLAVWIYALYPEGILLGGAQMRDPLLMGLSAILLWIVCDWRRLKWKAAGLAAVVLALLAAFSWLVALPVAGILGLWWWIDFSGTLPQKRLRWLGWVVIGVVGLAALTVMAAWLRESALWDSILTVRNSGKIQTIYDKIPVFLRDPFVWVYGLLQPVLPAAIFDPSVPVWTTISILRSLGWYALLPLLIYALPAAFAEKRGLSRNLMLWTAAAAYGWIYLSSFRAGGDLWDNPRYRTLLLPLIALGAAWAWVRGRERRDPWLARIFACEGVFLLAFSVWYAGRSLAWMPMLRFELIVGVIVLAWVAIIVVGWVSDALRNARLAAPGLESIDTKIIQNSWRDISILLIVTCVGSLFLPLAYFGQKEPWFEALRWYHHAIPVLTAVLAAAILGLRSRPVAKPLLILTRQVLTDLNQHRGLAVLVGVLAAVPLPVLEMSSALVKARPYLPSLYLFGLSAAVGILVLWSFRPAKGVRRVVAPTLTLFALAYFISIQLPRITNYPFTLDWSEGSRIYEASQVYSLLVYGVQLPLPLLDVGRAILQGIPFLVSGLPIAAHRLWLLALELGATAVTAGLLARRLQLRNRAASAFYLVWAMLFLFQGPIFPHLIVVSWLVLWRFDERSPWKNLIWVLAASVWAGLTRVNWFPLAGSLAALLYLLSTAQEKKQNGLTYLLPPAVYIGAGSLTSFLVYLGYIQVSGNPSTDFGTSLSTALIWDRLWPNASFGLGILPGILLVSLPLVTMVAAHLIRCRGAWKPLRLAALGAVLLVFLAGGVIVSLKMGGGNNLHNLDAFLLLLLTAGSLILSERFIPDAPRLIRPVQWTPVWFALAVLIPMSFALSTPQIEQQPSQAETKAALEYIQQAVARADAKGQSVLWLSERQLLAFHQVAEMPLIPEYERVVIAEMAMADNEDYFEQYRADLAAKKFGLIIVEPINIEYVGESQSLFAHENNRFVEEIFSPILEDYHANRIFKAVDVAVMAPKADLDREGN